jgi:hypothetical protein
MAERTLRVLDFDIENRPLAYLGGDFTTGEITAIAWCWVGRPKTLTSRVLGDVDMRRLLADFVAVYNEADIVTGHFIRGHDLPVVNGALMEHGLASLDQKMTSDTKLDLVSRKHLSASQENLGEMLGIPAPKVHMSNAAWREANRLTKKGRALTRERAEGDIVQHMAIRAALIERGLLGAPKVWRP